MTDSLQAHVEALTTKEPTLEERDITFEDATQFDSADITASPEQLVAAAVALFGQIDEQGYTLNELKSFEQVMVGVMVRMFKLMQEKQRGYGKSNISKAGLHGLFTRATDKIERAKNIVGDPVDQVDKAVEVLDFDLDNASRDDLVETIEAARRVLNPQTYAEESIEDTLIDLANYGLIMYMVQSEAWGRDMEENL